MAILIFAVGAGVSIYQGVLHILRPAELINPIINYVVLGLAILFEAGAWWFAFTAFGKAKGRQGYFQAVRTGKDPTLFVVLFEDSAALIGLVVALLGVGLTQYTGDGIYDGMAYQAMNTAGMGAVGFYSWPGAEIGFMDPDVGVNVAYANRLGELEGEQREAERQRLIDEIGEATSPYEAAGTMRMWLRLKTTSQGQFQ